MNTNIDVEGVVSRRQDEAKNEIIEYLTIFTKSFSEEVTISKVIVASDFEQTINNLWSGSKEYGLKYKAKRYSVKAVGKILHNIENNNISFIVIIDGKYIGNWQNNEKATRFEIFLHEFVHAFLMKKRFKRMGVDGFRNDYSTIEGTCFSLALSRDEYVVDSYMDILCKKFLTDINKEPLGLKRLNLERGINYLDTFMQLLNDMPNFVRTHIMEFKTHKKNISEFWNIQCSFVDELLTVFAHLAGSQDKEEDWENVSKTISNTEAYKTFLVGHLKNIYLEWINFFMDGYDEVKSLEVIRNEIKEIFHHCGLNFKNVDKGIYITVNSID
jgi:hypothetical protein